MPATGIAMQMCQTECCNIAGSGIKKKGRAPCSPAHMMHANSNCRDFACACASCSMQNLPAMPIGKCELQGSADVDKLGNPYGFTTTPLTQHTPSFPVLLTTQMSRPRSVNQLILLSDGHYLSSSTASLSLRIVAYNANARSLAYARTVFVWQDAGLITATPPFILALPVLAYASYAPSRYNGLHCGQVLLHGKGLQLLDLNSMQQPLYVVCNHG